MKNLLWSQSIDNCLAKCDDSRKKHSNQLVINVSASEDTNKKVL